MTRKSNTKRTLAQAAGDVLLATADADLGVVPANSAADTAQQIADAERREVTLRDATTDELIATVTPSSTTTPKREKAKPNKKKLTELFVRKAKPGVVWDTLQRGTVLRVQPSGRRSWYAVYNRHGRTRWLHLGPADAIGLANARQLAAEEMLEVARGHDPAAERKAKRSSGSFSDLADRYLEHSNRVNKSWAQGRALVVRYALPRWKSLQAVNIGRSDVKALISSLADRPALANAVLASTSAIFSWAVREDLLPTNPCKLISSNEVRSRERVLSDSEVALFWRAFDEVGGSAGAALKCILLCGSRPGEVSHMRREHVKDGFWEMPGDPVPTLGWLGTKNGASHRLWLSAPVRELIGEGTTGFVFAGPRGRPVYGLDMIMRSTCTKLGVERATPHDFRRTFSTTVTSLGFGRDVLNRVTNHREGGIASVYDRHGYADENKRIMEATAAKLLSLAGVALPDNVLNFAR
jgi:integrase